jgi:hypothetical protein
MKCWKALRHCPSKLLSVGINKLSFEGWQQDSKKDSDIFLFCLESQQFEEYVKRWKVAERSSITIFFTDLSWLLDSESSWKAIKLETRHNFTFRKSSALKRHCDLFQPDLALWRPNLCNWSNGNKFRFKSIHVYRVHKWMDPAGKNIFKNLAQKKLRLSLWKAVSKKT